MHVFLILNAKDSLKRNTLLSESKWILFIILHDGGMFLYDLKVAIFSTIQFYASLFLPGRTCSYVVLHIGGKKETFDMFIMLTFMNDK